MRCETCEKDTGNTSIGSNLIEGVFCSWQCHETKRKEIMRKDAIRTLLADEEFCKELSVSLQRTWRYSTQDKDAAKYALRKAGGCD